MARGDRLAGHRHPLGRGPCQLLHGPRGLHRPVPGRGPLRTVAMRPGLRLLAGPDPLHAVGRPIPIRLVRSLVEGGEEGAEGELRVREQTAVEAMVPAEVASGGIDLDDRGRLREGGVLDVPHLLEELATDEQDEIRVADGGAHLGVVAEAAPPHAGVTGRSVHVHREDVPVHVGPEPLGERDELLPRPAPGDPVPGEDDRAPGAQHEARGLRHSGRVRGGPAPDPRRGDRRPRGALVHHVEREGDEHRARGRVLRDLERPVEELRQLAGRLRLCAPLGDRGSHRDEVVPQHGLAEPEAGVLLARGHHEGGPPLPGVVERAHAVAEPGADVEVRDSDPAGRLRPGVRHGHRDRLLEGQDVPDRGIVLEGVHERQLGRARIAEEVLDPFRHQRLHHDLAPRPGP